MEISIIEPNANNAGHYASELNAFCNSVIELRPESHVAILTPFGLRGQDEHSDGCKVYSLLNPARTRELIPRNFGLYHSQPEFYRCCASWIQERLPDIVHIWGYQSVYPLWKYLRIKRLGVPVAMNLKAIIRERYEPRIPGLACIRSEMSYRILRQVANKYVVHTEALREQAVKIGIPGDKLHLFPTGIYPTPSPTSQAEARRFHSLDEHLTILLFPGVIRREKGIHRLLELALVLQDDERILIVGEDATEEGMTCLLENAGVADRVMLRTGYQDEKNLSLYFSAADAIIVSHLPVFVGESGVLLQAIQHNTPVIGVDHGHTGEYIRRNNIGVTYRSNSHASFREAVSLCRQIIAHPEEFLASCSTLQSTQAWKEVTREYLQMYDDMLPPVPTAPSAPSR